MLSKLFSSKLLDLDFFQQYIISRSQNLINCSLKVYQSTKFNGNPIKSLKVTFQENPIVERQT